MRGFARRAVDATDWLVVGAGLLAALPVLVATVNALDAGWTPSSDDGIIALRAFDVISPHPPLVGQYSQSSPLVGEPVYSLGPMLYWLLAVPAHVTPRALPVAMGLVNAVCVVGAVLLAARRGGRPLALATALLLVLTTRALPVEAGYEVWNCWAGLFPFTLLLFVGWSVACGDHRLLPLLAVTASYVVQIHFTYAVPALMAVLVAVVGLSLYRSGRPAVRLRPWAIAALAAALLCWSPALVDQAIHRPGNLTLAYRLATYDQKSAGLEAGWNTAARAVGIAPSWVRTSRSPPERLIDTLSVPTARAVSAAVVAAALAALLVVALRRRRHEAAAALGLALLLMLAMVIDAATVPASNTGLAALTYVLVWTVPAGMWVWLALGWSAAVLAPVRLALPRTAFAAGLAAIGAAAVLVAAGRDYDDPLRFPPGLKDYRLVAATTEQVVDRLHGSDGVLIDTPVGIRNGLTFHGAIAYALRRAGLAISAQPRLVKEMGRHYRRGVPAYRVLAIRDPAEPAPPGSRVLVRNRAVSVMLMP